MNYNYFTVTLTSDPRFEYGDVYKFANKLRRQVDRHGGTILVFLPMRWKLDTSGVDRLQTEYSREVYSDIGMNKLLAFGAIANAISARRNGRNDWEFDQHYILKNRMNGTKDVLTTDLRLVLER